MLVTAQQPFSETWTQPDFLVAVAVSGTAQDEREIHSRAASEVCTTSLPFRLFDE